MVEAVGGKIVKQFFGTISRVRKENNMIIFSEASLKDNGESQEHKISSDSIIVLVGPLPLQASFLRAGAKTLLLPQNRRQVDENKEVIFAYNGLLQVHKIDVVTSQWHGQGKNDEGCVKERVQITQT